MELHSCAKVQEHVGQIGALAAQLVEDRVSNELDGQLNVS